MIVKMHEAKTHFSKLVQRVLDGEEVIVARGSQPVVKLVALSSARRRRRLGTAKGRVEMAADFDAPIADFDTYR